MPLLDQGTNNNVWIWGRWRIDESIPELESAFSQHLPLPVEYLNLVSEERKKQWLSARLLIASMSRIPLHKLVKDTWGRPRLGLRFCSITHARGVAMVMLSDRACGIDIERPQERLRLLAHKFLHAEELLQFPPERAPLATLTLLWCAKEALYKLYGSRGLSLRTHYRIVSLEPDHLEYRGRIHACIYPSEGDPLPFRLHYRQEPHWIWAQVEDENHLLDEKEVSATVSQAS